MHYVQNAQYVVRGMSMPCRVCTLYMLYTVKTTYLVISAQIQLWSEKLKTLIQATK